MGEAVQSISVADNALAFDIVKNFANFLGGALAMVQERDEIGDRPLEVNVVFP